MHGRGQAIKRSIGSRDKRRNMPLCVLFSASFRFNIKSGVFFLRLYDYLVSICSVEINGRAMKGRRVKIVRKVASFNQASI